MSSPDAPATAEESARPVHRIDTTVAHPARRYNYWLGGKDHFQADRDSGDETEKLFPTVRAAALENRGFMRRAVTFLAGEVGIRQFLDIGTGIPAPNNTHEVAQRVAPESRVVYVDNDPIVMSHARALLTSAPGFGPTDYLEADLRDYETILSHPTLRNTIDFSEPVGLLLVAILHFLNDRDDPQKIISRLANGLPAGSYVVASNSTLDFSPPVSAEIIELIKSGPGGFHVRNKAEFGKFFEGMELVEPGIVALSDWRAENEPQPRPDPGAVCMYGAVARIP